MNPKAAYLPVQVLSALAVILCSAAPIGADEKEDMPQQIRPPIGEPPAEAEAGIGSKPFSVPLLPFALGTLALGAPSAGVRSAVDPWDVSDEDWSDSSGSSLDRGKATFSAAFNFYGHPHAEFEFADLDEKWDEAWRYELEICGYYEVSGHVEPYAGAYFYFDDRRWKDGNASMDNQVYGFGGEFGALIYALKKADKRLVNIPIVPFLKVGMGFNDGTFDNIPNGDDRYFSGDLDSLRFEIGGGVDVRFIIARRVMIGLGGGVLYWNSFQVDGVSRNGVGVIIVRDDEADYHGLDTFIRLSVAVLF